MLNFHSSFIVSSVRDVTEIIISSGVYFLTDTTPLSLMDTYSSLFEDHITLFSVSFSELIVVDS